jgi:hypothetical protein
MISIDGWQKVQQDMKSGECLDRSRLCSSLPSAVTQAFVYDSKNSRLRNTYGGSLNASIAKLEDLEEWSKHEKR